MDWAFRQCGNLKIDTHRDNHIMQHLLERKGFTYCGIIHTDNGAERLAYQKSAQKKRRCRPVSGRSGVPFHYIILRNRSFSSSTPASFGLPGAHASAWADSARN